MVNVKKNIFRLICLLLSIGYLLFGIIYVYNGIMRQPFEFDSTFKVALASCCAGIFFVIKFIKGK